MASNDQWFMQPPPPHHELTTNSRSLRQSHDAWGVPGLALQRRATTTARIVAVLAHKWCTQVYRNATNPQRHRSRARSLSTLCPPVASGEKRPSPHGGGDWGEKFEWRLGGGVNAHGTWARVPRATRVACIAHSARTRRHQSSPRAPTWHARWQITIGARELAATVLETRGDHVNHSLTSCRNGVVDCSHRRARARIGAPQPATSATPITLNSQQRDTNCSAPRWPPNCGWGGGSGARSSC